jgi:uncharacterized protein
MGNDPLTKKELKLIESIKQRASGKEGVAVAFSGGVDSGLLLLEAVQALGKGRVVAITAQSPTSIAGEIEDAKEFCQDLGVRHILVDAEEMSDPVFLSNPHNRCYICKRIRYNSIRLAVESMNYAPLDGSQADDNPEERPGMAALEELDIGAPLMDAGLTKADIRELLRRRGYEQLSNKPAQPCLATRIPFDTEITPQALKIVAQAEESLKGMGFKTVRVRHHWPIARIVTDEYGMNGILTNPKLRRQIVGRLKGVGYTYVVLDLEQYGQ